jgi:hypothetical protein
VSLLGGPADQRVGLLDNRQESNKGTQLLHDVEQGLDQIKDAGQGVREELEIQVGKERPIEGRLDEIQTETGLGSNIINRMWRREDVRTVAIWIVVAVVIGGLGVFLYLVFR